MTFKFTSEEETRARFEEVIKNQKIKEKEEFIASIELAEKIVELIKDAPKRIQIKALKIVTICSDNKLFT